MKKTENLVKIVLNSASNSSSNEDDWEFSLEIVSYRNQIVLQILKSMMKTGEFSQVHLI